MRTILTSNLVILVLVLVLLGPSWALADEGIYEGSPPTADGGLFVPGEFLVKFNPHVPEQAIEQMNAVHGSSVIEVGPLGWMKMSVPKGKSIDEIVGIFSKNPNVEYAQPNSICHAFGEPNDPYYSYQWHLDNEEYGGINASAAWDISTGAGVTVAVLDTGVAYGLSDLASTSFSIIADSDIVNNDSDPYDDNSHGTHVAGTIAQSTNNGSGVAGVAYDATIMPIKVLDANGSGDALTLAAGLYLAADSGAQVINMSLGWGLYRGKMYDPGPVVHDAVTYAYNKGVTIVAASGNDGWKAVAYPAAYPECIAVGATQYDEAIAPYSNRGTDLDIVAPGGNTGLDQNGDGYSDGVLQQTFDPATGEAGYYFFQGTSMATPHVAGVAALVIAASGNPLPAYVKNVLEATAEDHGDAGWDKSYGNGIVDAYQAVVMASGVSINQAPVADAGGDQLISDADGDNAETVILDGSGSYDLDGSIVSYDWDVTGDGNSDLTGMVVNYPFSVGSHVVTLLVTDNDGATALDSVTITVTAVVSGDTMTVDNISCRVIGGKHLITSATVVDSNQLVVSGATVTIDLFRDDNIYTTLEGVTGSDGAVQFKMLNAPAGVWYGKISDVSHPSMIWDGIEAESAPVTI